MALRSQIRTRLISIVFGTMVFILASYRAFSSVRFVSDYNLTRRSIIDVAPRVSAMAGRLLWLSLYVILLCTLPRL